MKNPTEESVAVSLRTVNAMLDEAGVPHGRSTADNAPMTPEGRIRWLVDAYLRALAQLRTNSDSPNTESPAVPERMEEE